jgi:hypothetical protein
VGQQILNFSTIICRHCDLLPGNNFTSHSDRRPASKVTDDNERPRHTRERDHSDSRLPRMLHGARLPEPRAIDSAVCGCRRPAVQQFRVLPRSWAREDCAGVGFESVRQSRRRGGRSTEELLLGGIVDTPQWPSPVINGFRAAKELKPLARSAGDSSARNAAGFWDRSCESSKMGHKPVSESVLC